MVLFWDLFWSKKGPPKRRGFMAGMSKPGVGCSKSSFSNLFLYMTHSEISVFFCLNQTQYTPRELLVGRDQVLGSQGKRNITALAVEGEVQRKRGEIELELDEPFLKKWFSEGSKI